MTRSSKLSLVTVSLAIAASLALLRSQPMAQPQSPSTKLAAPTNEIAALRAELEVLKGKATDQAHVMNSVAYHYANLWFAGQKKNWPLAEFYWAETRSHMRWAVRVIPVRKDSQGNEVRLQEILDPIEKSAFEELHKSISEKSVERFRDSYKQMLDSCFACHMASGKSFLKLQIPVQPPEPLIRFEPEP
jgi:hypothetical protein